MMKSNMGINCMNLSSSDAYLTLISFDVQLEFRLSSKFCPHVATFHSLATNNSLYGGLHCICWTLQSSGCISPTNSLFLPLFDPTKCSLFCNKIKVIASANEYKEKQIK